MKIKLVVVLLMYSSISFAQKSFNLTANNANDKSGKIVLTEDRYEAFKQRSLEKVTDLGNYIVSITDKTMPLEQAKMAVNLAVALFQDETKKVEVSSKTTGKVTSSKVRLYFNKLRILKYSKVNIKWYDIQYISNLRLDTEGNYWGIITIFQKFEGYKGNEMTYEDITQKNIEIKVTKIKTVRGTDWEVLLGNISVVETK